MKLETLIGRVAVLGAATLLICQMAEGAAFDKRALQPEMEGFSAYDMKAKRPFCNAFTGLFVAVKEQKRLSISFRSLASRI